MNTSSEERKEIALLAAKTLFKSTLNTIPVVGSILNDVLFEYRSSLKQKRLNDFVDSLKEYFSGVQTEININNIQSESFSDLFENVLMKISQTRNSKKIEGFKYLLLKGMGDHYDVEECELFSELLFDLNDIDLLVLNNHLDYLFEGEGLIKMRELLESDLERSKNFKRFHIDPDGIFVPKPVSIEVIDEKLVKIKSLLVDYKKNVQAENFNISSGNFKYIIQKLSSKGLLVDEGVGAVGTRPFEIMAITEFGKKFMDFIKYS